ncbi:glycosyltransferase [Qipengyuania gaetbuli]|uniref:glycosyltransferase n=1 Tax=Qipengyuania gaetbuli TaxID=266952 RepID=UPI001CFDDD03|nr:glycosyltransferase [Qipengyuania gaetbuli]
MKIVHFGKYYPPEYGGIESVTEALAEDHAAKGHNVDVVCFTRGAACMERKGRLTLRRIRVWAEKVSQPLALSYVQACIRAGQDADLVHVHTPNVLAALAVCLLPRHTPAIVHWHADIAGKGIMGRLVRPIERAMLRRASLVVVTTKAYGDTSAALAPFSDRIKVIPIGIADLENPPESKSVQRPYVLFVGRLVPYKGLSVLLDAISRVESDAEFRIVGVGPQETALKKQAQRLAISNRVTFMGRVDEARLQEQFAGAAVFCLPSVNRLEAFGVVLLEAMRAGRAIIATDIPGSGVPWVNSSGINVPVEDPKALAEVLDFLLADSEEIFRLGESARARFEKEFSRELMSARFLEVYEEVLNRETKP